MISQTTKKKVAAANLEAAQLRQGCQLCLQQCAQLLDHLSCEDYSRQAGTSSIGAHVRHILERFQSFLAGLQNRAVNYDARKRDRSLEQNPEAAAFALGSVSRRIEELLQQEPDSLQLTITESVHPQLAPVTADSSIERELVSLISHSTHHLAIIAMLARPLGYELSEDFGKAPSTVVHERG